MDDDFFEFIEDELCYTGGSIDIGLFALYYLEWEKVMVKKKKSVHAPTSLGANLIKAKSWDGKNDPR